MVAIPMNAFTSHGSGLASLSRNLIKTFNIREIPDVDGTPPPFHSIRFNAFPGYVCTIRFYQRLFTKLTLYSRTLRRVATIFPTVLVSRYSVHRSLRSERLIVDPHGRKKER